MPAPKPPVNASISELQEFHRRHKLLLLAHNPKLYRQLGPLVANAERLPPQVVRDRYATLFEAALLEPASAGNRANALQHAAGYLRDRATPEDRKALEHEIARYQRGVATFEATLQKAHELFEKYRITYLLEQVFLEPGVSD